MKVKVIKFKNGSSIETLPNAHTVIRSDIKYLFPKARGNGKPALSMIQFLEMYRGTELTDSDSYLMSMTKKQLIEQIRILEHNIDVLQEQSDNQYKLLMEVYFKDEGSDSDD